MPVTQCGTWHAWRCPVSRVDTSHCSCVCFYRHFYLTRLGTYTSARRSSARRPGLSPAWMATWSSVRSSPCTTSHPPKVWPIENAGMCASSTAFNGWRRCSIRWTVSTPTRTCCPTSPWAARSGTRAGTHPLLWSKASSLSETPSSPFGTTKTDLSGASTGRLPTSLLPVRSLSLES